jgi:hypothetical protein
VFAYRSRCGRVEVAFTDRHGGVSDAPFDSLNLGFATGDDPAAVERNAAAVAEAFGSQRERLVTVRQVHGAGVAVVSEPAGETPAADALVTTTPDLTLCVRAADCVPVLLADPAAGVIGSVHAGRGGMVAGVVTATVEQMAGLGARRLTAWVGPHICGACYEVPEEMRDEVSAMVPQSSSTTRWGTAGLDIGAGVRAQLAALGCEIVDAGGCTYENADLFSYRREGPRSGRAAGLVRLLA